VAALTKSSLHAKNRNEAAQAVVEFAVLLPAMLLLLLGLIDLGRAFVFGVAVQEGARQAARLAASANYDVNVDDSAVLGRLVAASAPALAGCPASTTANQACNGGTWSFSLSIENGGFSYATLAAARTAGALPGAKVTATARGSVGLLPGVNTGAFGMTMPQLGVRGQAAMVVL
jgi:Flp pilus assembly protein TadG